MKHLYLKLLALFMFNCAIAQTSYYVNQQTGNNSNDGKSANTPFQTVDKGINQLVPGDTLFLMGEIVNDSYNSNYSYSGNINDSHIWHQENTIRVNNLNGTSTQYITIAGYDDSTVIKGDGANIFRVTNSSYLRIVDLNIQGEVERIPLETALALQFLYRENNSTNTLRRVPEGSTAEDVENNYSTEGSLPKLNNISRPSYTDTRGIYFSNSHHIDFIGNEVHHTPGNGFRVSGGDYINIIGNEVHNCSRKSYSGTHGLVVTNSESFDNSTAYKIFIQKNSVHHNYNEIYSWAPDKTFITPKIDEGKGISLQRNDIDDNGTTVTSDDTGWLFGRILVENNVTYWNGYSGLHTNSGLRIDFVNNTAFMNSYTNSITNAGEEQSGKNIGMSAQGGSDNKFINNIIYIDNAWNGFPISLANESGTEVLNNLVFGINGSISEDTDVTAIDGNTTIVADPLFIDAGDSNASSYDFGIQQNSPAIGAADPSFAPIEDYLGISRDANPDLGALEYQSTLGLGKPQVAELKVYPNPFNNQLFIKYTGSTTLVYELFDLLGKKINLPQSNGSSTVIKLNLDQLASGVYILKTNLGSKKIMKP